MKIVRMWGGVGNALFQYMIYRSLKDRGDEVYIDDSWYNGSWRPFYYKNQLGLLNLNYESVPKTWKCNHFSLLYDVLRFSESGNWFIRFALKTFYSLCRIGRTRFELVTQKNSHHYSEEYFTKDDSYLVGYWLNVEYLKNEIETIKNEVEFPNYREDNSEYAKIEKAILATNSVSVHVRINDYAFENFTNDESEEYYRKAIDYFLERESDSHFFIFSNNMDKAKELIGEGDRFTFVNVTDRFNGLADMKLISLCKNNIISASTFSWWGAAFNKNPGRIVVVPSWWKKNNSDMNLLLDDGWMFM